ncbi:hypothetical protein JHK82_052119 [Glycine max]|nr:hypothetical protein JHK86_051949 [Glycine max]KAG4926317.1 hypothetical protein JHK85_052803 [Glycine max]KAG5081954.1 hypothetical protein JHK84_051992 [Glycine max]KAG5084722.1 hypothetical protein JHK82_052119 [Glycine max]
MESATSEAVDTGCSLKIQLSPLLNDSRSEEGDWDEILHNKCCGAAFDAYIYALGWRANQTGKIYLDSTEQRNCLSRMKSLNDDVFGCGIENLTSGAGGCSDLLVSDVRSRLGNELRSLDENCQQSCSLCLKTWNTIGGTDSRKTNAKTEKIEADLCRIAVLVTLISSKIENVMYVKTVLRCLGAQHIYSVTFGDMLRKTACPRVPIKEVYAATNHLNEMNIIGKGTSGKVYKGTMTNNLNVAIKHIINDDGNVNTFVREITSLSHVRHPNIVALLSYCVEGDERFLVYELCPNGSLSEWLFGLKYNGYLIELPTFCMQPTNILLGSKFEAKLSDFGLSKVIEVGETYVSSEVRGTFGYVDPEYQSNHHVNSSGDVYSFGMVLLQILSGKKVINLKLKKPMPLNKVAKAFTRDGRITGFADPKLQGEYSEEAFDFALKLALSCTALNQQRPSMEQVVKRLEEALFISKGRKASTPETPADNISNP